MRKNYKEPEDIEVKEIVIEEPAPWIIGEKYTTHQDLYLWEDAGENKKDYEEDGQGYPDEFGKTILNIGTIITVEDVKKVDDKFWIKTPSGWICGKNPKITYVS